MKFWAISLLSILLFSSNTQNQKDNKTVCIKNQKDFDQYKNSEFIPGTQILFAAGKIFNGQFAPTGSGTKDNPIIITAYDPESKTANRDWIENKPIINGLGKVKSPIYLYNAEHWEINNLEITNTDGSKADQGILMGIYIVAENSGIMEERILVEMN